MQVGLASISAGVHRAGGSRAHPGSALDEALELRAASIEGGASGEAIAMGTAPSHLAYSPYTLPLYPLPCLVLSLSGWHCALHNDAAQKEQKKLPISHQGLL